MPSSLTTLSAERSKAEYIVMQCTIGLFIKAVPSLHFHRALGGAIRSSYRYLTETVADRIEDGGYISLVYPGSGADMDQDREIGELTGHFGMVDGQLNSIRPAG